ncbi:flagellar hook-length control protein FliK, partial [Anaerospora hongkongensis]|uniref:flagellar hook-length control protein FliK n=1 Tax=Anaerospora hongkongensis TaxID=244830 RepID=UPI002FD9EF83
KSGAFGTILDSATEAGGEPGKGQAKNTVNDNLAFLALNGIILAALPVNTQDQVNCVQETELPAAIAPVNSGEMTTAGQTAAVNAFTDIGGNESKGTNEMASGLVQNLPTPASAEAQTIAPGLPIINVVKSAQQASPSAPEVPVISQSVQSEMAGNAASVSSEQAAVLNELLRADKGQAAGNSNGDELAVLAAKANPVVAQAIRTATAEPNPVKKNEDTKKTPADEPAALLQDDGLQNVAAAVNAKEAAGKDEQQDKPTDSKQAELPVDLLADDSSADFGKVESVVNRQATVVDHIQPVSLAKPVEAASVQRDSGVSQDPHNIAGQIVEQARMINRVNNSEMVVKLKPEHLGELTLKVTVENGAVSASFHSNNQEVRTVIEASLTQLRQELSNQGLKVENVGVYAGLNQFFSNDQQQQTAQQQQIKFKNRRQEESFIDAIEAAAVLPTTSDAGVDYRI